MVWSPTGSMDHRRRQLWPRPGCSYIPATATCRVDRARCGRCSATWPRAGFRPGPIDGRYGPLTERAVISVPDRSPPPRRRHRRPTNAGPAPTRNATAGSPAAASTDGAASSPPPPASVATEHQTRSSAKDRLGLQDRVGAQDRVAAQARTPPGPASGPSTRPVADRHRLPDPGGAGGTAVASAPSPRKSTASSTDRADPTPDPSRAGPVSNPGRGARGGARSGGLGVSSSRGRRVQVRTPARRGRQSRPCRGCVSSG